MNKKNFYKPSLFGVLGLLVCFVIFAASYITFTRLQNNAELIQNLNHQMDRIIYLDEVLTMSARLSALTGDMIWQTRYEDHVEQLDEALANAYALSKGKVEHTGTAQTDAANQALIEMERRAFELARQGELEQARTLLFSNRYNEQKKLYTQGMDNQQAAFAEHVIQLKKERTLLYVGGLLISFVSVLFLMVAVVSIVHAQSRQRERERMILQNQNMVHIGRLAGGMAHEINNALQPIIGLGETVKRKIGTENIMLHEYMDVIYNSALHARDIVANVLLFARSEDHKPEVLQANKIFKDAADFGARLLPSGIVKKISFTDQFAKRDDVKVFMNKTHIVQIFTNLFKNAAYAMKDKGMLVVNGDIVKIAKEQGEAQKLKPGEYIEIKVTDTGEGIPATAFEDIFTPFYTTKPVDEGTGLGLSMIFGILRDMGGGIFVESEMGVGSTFTLYFPRYQG